MSQRFARRCVDARSAYVGTMKAFMILLVVAAALATVGVLARGIYIMATGKDATGRRSNQLMWYRVMFQGLTVLLVVLFMAIAGRHG